MVFRGVTLHAKPGFLLQSFFKRTFAAIPNAYFGTGLQDLFFSAKRVKSKAKVVHGIPIWNMQKDCGISSQISKIENAIWDVQLSTIFELANGLGVEPKGLLDFKI